jgi:hypothetical protein
LFRRNLYLFDPFRFELRDQAQRRLGLICIAARFRAECDLFNLTHLAASLDGFVEQGCEGLAVHLLTTIAVSF